MDGMANRKGEEHVDVGEIRHCFRVGWLRTLRRLEFRHHKLMKLPRFLRDRYGPPACHFPTMEYLGFPNYPWLYGT